MGKFNEIQEIIQQLPSPFRVEEIRLENALNRILREDIFADDDMPAFHKSAMDGYACHSEDLGNELEVLEIIKAGMLSSKTVGRNQCSKIMTGAAVPDGCDIVFKVEDSAVTGTNRVKCTRVGPAKNICYKGEDYKKGDLLIKKGTLIREPQMAVLAGSGKTRLKVTAMPGISLIATGNELVEPSEKPGKGRIRNSNTSQLISQLRKMNLEVKYIGLAEDDFRMLSELLVRTSAESDIVIFTGGASVGDFDFIRAVLDNNGFHVLWDHTGIKPGNPMTFSHKGDTFCFGLSGNPVSSLVQFEMIVKPVIYKLLGARYRPLRIQTMAAFDLRLKKSDRLQLIPVIINEAGMAEMIPFHGSAHIHAMVYADALMEIPEGQSEIKKGEPIYARPL